MYKALAAVVLVIVSLTGCGSLRLVDTDVRSYVTPPGVAAGASYRFERLPSQQAEAASQARLEAMAQAALGKVGLQRQDRTPDYSVQVAASLRVDPHAPWDTPTTGWRMGLGLRRGSVTLGGGLPLLPGWGDLPYYWREVSLLIRHLGSNQVVYETHAAHQGRWADSDAVLPAMLEAALQDFPHPPTGVRRINLEIPR